MVAAEVLDSVPEPMMSTTEQLPGELFLPSLVLETVSAAIRTIRRQTTAHPKLQPK